MTTSLFHLSGASGEVRTAFVDEFVDAVSAASSPVDGGAPPSPAYTRMVLDVASSRPFELFLAFDNGRVVGRTMVATSYGQPATAVLGLFELESGPRAAATGDRLITAASEWAERTGHDRLVAPVDLTTWFDYRFMLPPDGAGTTVPRFAWEPPHRPAYLHLFRQSGFTDADLYRTIGAVFDDAGPFAISRPVEATAGAYQTAVAAGYMFERVTSAGRLACLLDELHPLCSDAFRCTPLFEPLPLGTFRALYTRAAAVRDSTLTHIVRRSDGRLVGFVFAFIDRDAVIIKTIAVTPDARGRRLSTALVHLVLDAGATNGHRAFVSALVRAGNTSQFLTEPHLAPGMRSWTHEYVLLHRAVR